MVDRYLIVSGLSFFSSSQISFFALFYEITIPLRKLMQAQVTPQRDVMEGRNLQIPCLSSALCNPDRFSRARLSALNWFLKRGTFLYRALP